MANAGLLLPSGTSVPGGDPLVYLARKARNRRDNAEAQHDYGRALLKAGHPAAAIEWLTKAVDLAPNAPPCHTNLAAALHQTGKWAEGLWHARRAAELDPKNSMLAANVGHFYYWLGEVPDAVEWCSQAIQLDPSSWPSWWTWLFLLDFTPISAEKALACRREFNAAHQTPLRPFWPTHDNDPDPEKKIRIGLTGGDFRQHSSSYMWGPIFEHLDRDRFEIVSYAHLTYPDALTDWFRKSSNGWREITDWDDRQVAAQIRGDKVDVLVDMGTFSEHSHLMAHLLKPAPVSLTAWGHLTGTGLDCMDAVLVDEVMVPAGREWEMTEAPAYVPYALGWYVPTDPIPLRPKPEDHTFTFGYLGRIQKLDDPTVALWADLLHAYPDSRLLLKDAAYMHERAATRTRERFEGWGIAPERIEMRGASSRDDHLRTYLEVDVSLDPLPQGGGATPLESLMMGVPCVTLRGERLVRRVGASTLTAAGHPEWVAENVHEYVEIAGRIAAEGGQQLRDSFLKSHICDGAARTRAFEAAVRDLWRGWCQGKSEA